MFSVAADVLTAFNHADKKNPTLGDAMSYPKVQCLLTKPFAVPHGLRSPYRLHSERETD